MLSRQILCLAFATIFLSTIFVQHVEGGKLKKIIAASVIANSLKPRFVPLPIPIPFKLKIKKGEKIVPYPVYSHDMMMYGGGGGGGYGGGGYGGGGNDWW